MTDHTSLRAAIESDATLRKQLAQLDASEFATERDAEQSLLRAQELLARIVWARLTEPGDGVAGVVIRTLGAAAAFELLVNHVSPQQLRAALAVQGVELGKELHSALGRWLPRLNRADTLSDIARACAAGVQVIVPADTLWPTALADLGVHEPLMLWLRGTARYLSTPSISVVGARAVTGYGTHITAEIVEGLSAAGLAITSGAAYGVDAVAHRTALALDTPTIAVLAGGVDRAYPAAHDRLLERITQHGVVCSEMIPGAAPTRWRFLQRNRIIAALSQATLVTEAGVRSGTINTAGHAASIGRPLGAVPGPVTSAASAGCHRLIREYDAELITNARDMLTVLGIDENAAIIENTHAANEHAGDSTDAPAHPGDTERELSIHRRVIDALPLRGRRPASEIARRAGLTAEQTSHTLAELQLLGKVRYEESPTAVAPEWSLVRQQ